MNSLGRYLSRYRLGYLQMSEAERHDFHIALTWVTLAFTAMICGLLMLTWGHDLPGAVCCLIGMAASLRGLTYVIPWLPGQSGQ